MTTKKPEPVLIAMSVLAGLQILFGGVGSVTFFADHELVAAICAVGMVAVGATQAGVMYYVRGQVVPIENVVEQLTPDGRVVAGEANDVVQPGTTVREVGERPRAEDEALKLAARLAEVQAELERSQSYGVDFTVDPPEGDHGVAGPGV